MATAAVEIRHLVKEFDERRSRAPVRAVDDISLDIREGEFFALLGPSGCGKTTTLRVVAGFEDPTSGEVMLRGTSMRGIPPFHRPVNTVFQDYALFPHMSVMQNVMFGLRMSRVAAADARARAEEALAMVRLPDAAARRPHQLSGGQKQRVALARALVNRPAVLLLDEPLGALDLKLRKAMQFELKQLQQQVGITFIYVTHDQEEALTMADRIAVMDGGRVLQVGRPDEIYERPLGRFVADFIGETNFLDGVLDGREGGRASLRLPGGQVVEAVLRDPSVEVGQPATLAIRPEKLAVIARAEIDPRPAGGAATALDGVIAEAIYLGTDTRYRVAVGGGLALIARIQNQRSGFGEMMRAGDPVRVSWLREHGSILR